MTLKWYHTRPVPLTKEYCAGMLAGAGFGMAFKASFDSPPSFFPWILVGMALIGAGGCWQMYLRIDKGKEE